VIAADQDILLQPDNQVVTSTVIRDATTLYRRYYHLPLFASNPGAAGATFTAPDANQVGGWLLDAAGEVLYMNTDVHSDWDGTSDLTMEVTFTVNVDNTGGAASDTVDLKTVFYYKGASEIATRTQTDEVATTIGACSQYTQFTAEFTIDYDAASQEVAAGDRMSMIINLETDTSEVDNIILNDASIHYNTTHIGIESGDV
jgi:hypothetical protein